MQPKKLFDGVYIYDGKVLTVNLAKRHKVYGEELFEMEGVEYRSWNPYRSKLSAAILNGMKNMHIRSGDSVLYLGAATGTTSSHVSDIVGNEGRVYCVELSERNMRSLIEVCSIRKNMLPILADARYIENYRDMVHQCDVLYQDVSAKEQAGIIKKNAAFLKEGGYAYFAIKSQSIDISRKPEDVFDEVKAEVSDTFEVVETIRLEPYDEMHLFMVMRKK
ncbi:MAG: fibrillarin-like rRNA/tRNA 2'-O-methyltransferase [Candidatus Marsarchaeota archaeon]|jgi:fibrillarin-like pre-rRNA processing protein|nr:fibrillarin-like rRNA/tRNA 2'-O-methyltransferase [Candidatus Marsarchaeota archaeon]MCL5112703.1 fibrillarin-like rRNA/tRNA 2'-O-methyltransferase [Candidatus Marsarchaeota archaeon]